MERIIICLDFFCCIFVTLLAAFTLLGCSSSYAGNSSNTNVSSSNINSGLSSTDTTTPASVASNSDTSTPTSIETPTTDTSMADTPTPQPQQRLQSFVLNNDFHFSDASGTSIPSTASLDPEQIKTDVQKVFQHIIFDLSFDGHMSILSGSPVDAQLSRNTDGSYTVSFNQTSNFTNTSATRTFQGTLTGDQITATYAGTDIGGDVVGGSDYIGGNNFTSSFTTQVSWITEDQIPATPSGGQCQFTNDGGVALSWASGGSSTYHVYSEPLATGNEQDLGTTTNSSYIDESPEGIQNANAATGIAYMVYSVGSSGIESPQSLNFLATTPFGHMCKALN